MLSEFWAKLGITRVVFTRIILNMGSANQRRCYNVMSPLIAWAHNQNDPWLMMKDEKEVPVVSTLDTCDKLDRCVYKKPLAYLPW